MHVKHPDTPTYIKQRVKNPKIDDQQKQDRVNSKILNPSSNIKSDSPLNYGSAKEPKPNICEREREDVKIAINAIKQWKNVTFHIYKMRRYTTCNLITNK